MFTITKDVVGSEGGHDYVVITGNNLGLVAVRRTSQLSYRVRVEPAGPEASGALAKLLHRNIFVDPSWKQPGDHGQERFSTVVESGQALIDVVAEAVAALASGGPVEEDWLGALAAVAELGSTDPWVVSNLVHLWAGKCADPLTAAEIEGMTTTEMVAKYVHFKNQFMGGESAVLCHRLKVVGIKGFALAPTWRLVTLRTKWLLSWPHPLAS